MKWQIRRVWLSGRTKQKFPDKAKAPEHDTIVKRGFRVDHEKILCSYVHEACFKRLSFWAKPPDKAGRWRSRSPGRTDRAWNWAPCPATRPEGGRCRGTGEMRKQWRIPRRSASGCVRTGEPAEPCFYGSSVSSWFRSSLPEIRPA